MERLKAYNGSDSYIFISYAHKDSEIVLPIIKKFTNNGYRTWYDEGVEPGKKWDDFIADHVIDCGYFIAFVSPSYLASSNCMDELDFARDKNKKLLLVYLEPVELPTGMQMRLNRLQAINKYSFDNEEFFYEKLFSSDEIAKMRDTVSSESSHQSKTTPSATSPDNHQKGTRIFSKGTYSGDITDGKPNGIGKMIWNSGGNWEGEWANGSPLNGNGTRYYNNGNIYIGKLKNGNPNGNGKMVWVKGGEWEGEWKEGKPFSGNGIICYSNGNIYNGEIRNRYRTFGKMIWAKGGEWEGEWKNNDVINGKGTYRYPNGNVFVGNLQYGKPRVYSQIIWALDDEWEGECINGNGTLYYNNGNIYIGELKNGNPNGNGKMIWALGGEWNGDWVDGYVYKGKGTKYFYKNGGVLDGRYEGEIDGGQCYGMGTMYWATTDEKTGERVITNQWKLSGEWRSNQIWNGKGHNAADTPYKKVRNGKIVSF